MTVKIDNTVNFEKLKKQYLTSLQIPINELELSELQKDAIADLQIEKILDLFQGKWTADMLDNQCVHKVSRDLNSNLESLIQSQLGASQPSGVLYSFYEPSQRRKLLTVHEKAVEIMLDVFWGNVSMEQMAKKLTYPIRGIVMKPADIELIINVSHFILELDTEKRINIDAIRAIMAKYPDLKSEIADLAELTQGQTDALERQGIHCVYHLYEHQMTSRQINKECIVLSGKQERSLAVAVNNELKQIDLPELAEAGDSPVGPFYALYRAMHSHSISGSVDRSLN